MEGECELCGRYGKLKEVIIEGSRLLVCEKCASLGKEVKSLDNSGSRSSFGMFVREKEKIVDIVPGFGKKIKNAREKLSLTQEELAKKLMVKSSLIAKLEREEIKPDEDLAKKIEKLLKIKIIEEYTIEIEKKSEDNEKKDVALTIGDLMKDIFSKKRDN